MWRSCASAFKWHQTDKGADPIMADDLISVAMATYNGARFLPQQLHSIAAQTRLPAELIICDDGSGDGTQQVVEEFARTAPFEVHWSPNEQRLGYVRNFRRAASLCRGQIIAFSDQDDEWSPNKLAAACEVLADPSVLLVYHNATVVDGEGRRLSSLYHADEEEAALGLSPIAPWHHSYGLVQLFRSHLRRFDRHWDLSLNHIPEPMDILSHDQWYIFLAQALGRVAFIDQELVRYRQHGNNAVGAVQKHSTAGASIAQRFRHYGTQDQRAALAAEARATILDRMAGDAPERAEHLRTLAAMYRDLAAKHHRRFLTYSGPGLPRRLARLLAAVGKGDYAGWPWGFDRRSIPRDLWSGVLLQQVREPG